LQGLAGCGLALRRLDSNNLEGAAHVAVTAFVSAPIASTLKSRRS
jgi:hypothetical protein